MVERACAPVGRFYHARRVLERIESYRSGVTDPGGAAMTLSRRKALSISGSTLAGLSLGVVKPGGPAVARAQEAQDWPDSLVERPLREGFPAPLPLNADGSAPEHPESAAGGITDPLMWRTQGRRTPEIEFDYRRMAIRVDTRGMARLSGTLRFSDLEQLPVVSGTWLLQCGAPNPRGIVKWPGVRFSDFADMLGVIPEVHYCRFVGSDRFYADEPMTTLRRPQVLLAWLMNDEPIPPRHGAPLRLIVPFRYGNRSVKAITEMTFSTPGPRVTPLPA
ncbi:MAG: molybdopterin-dependent oxidoreductase [Acidobacteria bacterium]|nr:molybdopterin-dependent oxidoreductase [Acidobacteriota bacterium]